jgi:HxlR-like helix-turn-helix
LHASQEPVALLLTYVVLKKASMSAPQHLSGCVLGGWSAEQSFVLTANNSRSSTIAGMGFVRREIFPEMPVRVEYSLTPFGKKIQPLLQEIDSWARKHLL